MNSIINEIMREIADKKIIFATDDSRMVKKGCLFIARLGETMNGSQFITQAISNGASMVIVEDESYPASSNLVPIYCLSDLKHHLLEILSQVYQLDLSNYAFYGVTGTNGKTSIAHLLSQVLGTGYIGTVGTGELNNLQVSQNTTPNFITLFPLLKAQVALSAWSIEVSSHALVQNRLLGLNFKTVIFTNLSHDHLDYHGNMEDYAKSKYLLFEKYGARQAVICIDDKWGQILANKIAAQVNVLTYGFNKQADIYPLSVEYSVEGIKCEIQTPIGKLMFQTLLIGQFNLVNLLAVVGALLCEKWTASMINEAMSSLKGITGRMEIISQQPTFVVDYAHTPDALEKALIALRPLCKGKLWCVFGCGGDRDHAKRPLMGDVAVRLADQVLITSDNPRGESPLKIIEEIKKGMSGSEKVVVKQDRHQAIEYCFNYAHKNDVILVAGKGHEDYQIVGDKILPFSDQKVINEMLNNKILSSEKN